MWCIRFYGWPAERLGDGRIRRNQVAAYYFYHPYRKRPAQRFPRPSAW